MLSHTATDVQYTDFHFFCGAGGAGKGFGRSSARVGSLRGRFRSLGGIDSNPDAVADFGRLVGTPATCLDLFTARQYRQFHGHAPPDDWRAATYHDVRAAAGHANPDVVFLSPPCKGFSGLLSKNSAKSEKYGALNDLVVRSVNLMMEAWGDDPPSLILIENVPRIQQRGRSLLDEVIGLLDMYGYAVAETTHDCGELGGLAQHRKRFLLVARHRGKVRNFLYEPPKRRVRAVGEVLNTLPLPETGGLGPMHRCPRLQWRTWVRLALIPAGGDWRALQGLDWERYAIESYGQHHGLRDPRLQCDVDDRVHRRYNNVYRVARYDSAAPAVTGGTGPSAGGVSVADPRHNGWGGRGKYRVTRYDEPTGAVIAASTTGNGAFAIADPRPPRDLGRYCPYGVLPWSKSAGTVTGEAAPGAGVFSVADPRVKPTEEPAPAPLPIPKDKERPDPIPVIVSLDGTWHRPFTTLECAALQGFPVLDPNFAMVGKNHEKWRERIGNAIPIGTAEAIGSTVLHCLLLQEAGVSFELSATPIWVQPLAIALSMDRPRPELELAR